MNFPPHSWPTHKDNRRRDAFVLALYYDNDVTLTTDAPCFAKHNTFETGTCLDVRKLLSKFTLERIEQVCTLQSSIEQPRESSTQLNSVPDDSRSNTPSDTETIIYKSRPSSPPLTELSDNTLDLLLDNTPSATTSTVTTQPPSTAPFSARKRQHFSPPRSLYQETYTSLIREPSRKNLTETMDFSVTKAQDMSSRDGSLDVHFNSYDPSTQRYRPLQIECVDSTSKRSPIKLARSHSPITHSSRSSSTDRSRSRTTEKTYEPFVPIFPPSK